MTAATEIRPPWPDELARLAQAFPDLRLTGACRLLVVVARHPYERLVGAALVGRPSGEGPARPCELVFQLRPRFQAETVRLLEAAKAVLGAGESLAWQERTPEGGDAAVAPAQAGFACTQRHEVWRIPLVNCFRRRQPLLAALQRKAAASGYTVDSTEPRYQEGIVALVTAAGLLDAARVRFADEHQSGYDRALSTVVLREGAVVAAVLVRRQGPSAFVETRVVAPAHRGRFNLPNALLLDRPLEIAEASGLTEMVLTADPATASETIRFARKCGGARQSTLRRWCWPAA